MKYHFSDSDQNWIQNVYRKLCEKMHIECGRLLNGMIPDVPEEGRYVADMGEKDITCWVNGFWGGMMWQMYHATGRECYRKSVECVEARLDGAFTQFQGLHHDVGFMWLPTAVTNYRITGSERARVRGNSLNIFTQPFLRAFSIIFLKYS